MTLSSALFRAFHLLLFVRTAGDDLHRPNTRDRNVMPSGLGKIAVMRIADCMDEIGSISVTNRALCRFRIAAIDDMRVFARKGGASGIGIYDKKAGQSMHIF